MTLPDGSGGESQSEAEAEAVVWMALRHGPQWNSVAEVAHQRWLFASEVNAAAWRVATDVWEEEMAPARERLTLLQSRVDSVREYPAVGILSAPTGCSGKTAVFELTGAAAAGHEGYLSRRSHFFKKLSPAVWRLALLAAVIVGNPMGPRPDLASGREFIRSTKVGQMDLVALEDGSLLHLNTDTSVRVGEGPQRRQVVLVRGEVFAEVRHDEARPFHMVVGHVVIEDLGTEFDVITGDGQTRVTVLKGQVRIFERHDDGKLVDPFVAFSGGSKRESAVLERGNVIKVQERGDGTATVYKEPGNSAAAAHRIQWLQGRVSFNGQSLAEVVREINRYTRRKVMIDDPGIAGLMLSCGFDVHNVDRFVDFLPALGHIRATVVAAEGGSELEIHLRGPPHRKGQR